jgi:hypothetical protein
MTEQHLPSLFARSSRSAQEEGPLQALLLHQRTTLYSMAAAKDALADGDVVRPSFEQTILFIP